MFRGKILTDFPNLFLSHDVEKNDKLILNYFWGEYKHEIFFHYITLYNVGLVDQRYWRFFILEINEKEKISTTLNKRIVALDYAEKTLLVLSSASSDACFCSFTIVIDATVKITSVGFNLVLLISNRIVKVFLQIRGKKKSA